VGGAAVLLSLALFRGFPNPVHPLLVDGVITAALVRVLLAPNRWGYAWWCRSRLSVGSPPVGVQGRNRTRTISLMRM
jgi:hypothetical protein